MHQCSVYTSKEQYDRSHVILAEILEEQATINAIGTKAIEAIKSLQQKLKGKEQYLAYYIRKSIYMCLDAMMTSPVESMNEVIKHGTNAVDSNMNLSRSLTTIAGSVDDRYQAYYEQSCRDLGRTNRASQAPIADDMNKKCQYMLDYNFDRRITVCFVQESETTWAAWNFDEKDTIDLDCTKGPWPRLPRFHEVFKVELLRYLGELYLKCSCMHQDRCNFPCIHVFAVADEMAH